MAVRRRCILSSLSLTWSHPLSVHPHSRTVRCLPASKVPGGTAAATAATPATAATAESNKDNNKSSSSSSSSNHSFGRNAKKVGYRLPASFRNSRSVLAPTTNSCALSFKVLVYCYKLLNSACKSVPLHTAGAQRATAGLREAWSSVPAPEETSSQGS